MSNEMCDEQREKLKPDMGIDWRLSKKGLEKRSLFSKLQYIMLIYSERGHGRFLTVRAHLHPL